MLISTIGSSMIWPFLMVYASERLSLPLTQTATQVTLNSAASLVTNGLVYLFFSHAATYTQLAIVMLLLGASNPLYRIGADAMMADLIKPDMCADAYSVLRMSNNAGIAIGPTASLMWVLLSIYATKVIGIPTQSCPPAARLSPTWPRLTCADAT